MKKGVVSLLACGAPRRSWAGPRPVGRREAMEAESPLANFSHFVIGCELGE